MFYFLQHILTGAHAPKYCDTFDRPKSPLKFDLDTIYLKYYKDKTIDYQAKIWKCWSAFLLKWKRHWYPPTTQGEFFYQPASALASEKALCA
jgi:hypothetical protein